MLTTETIGAYRLPESAMPLVHQVQARTPGMLNCVAITTAQALRGIDPDPYAALANDSTSSDDFGLAEAFEL